jgi:hypothetical protein
MRSIMSGVICWLFDPKHMHKTWEKDSNRRTWYMSKSGKASFYFHRFEKKSAATLSGKDHGLQTPHMSTYSHHMDRCRMERVEIDARFLEAASTCINSASRCW